MQTLADADVHGRGLNCVGNQHNVSAVNPCAYRLVVWDDDSQSFIRARFQDALS